jgi:hypothetical protein
MQIARSSCAVVLPHIKNIDAEFFVDRFAESDGEAIARPAF